MMAEYSAARNSTGVATHFGSRAVLAAAIAVSRSPDPVSRQQGTFESHPPTCHAQVCKIPRAADQELGIKVRARERETRY